MAVRSLAQSTLLQNPSVNSMLAGYSFQDFHHLETVQLGGSATSVTFTNLLQYSGEFRHLQVRAVVRAVRSGSENTYFHMRFNSDSSAAYAGHLMWGNGSSVPSFGYSSATEIGVAWVASSAAPANIFGGAVIDIVDPFQTTKNKTTRHLGGVAGGAEPRPNFNSGLYMSMNPISSINLFSTTGDLITGSRFSLYGIR